MNTRSLYFNTTRITNNDVISYKAVTSYLPIEDQRNKDDLLQYIFRKPHKRVSTRGPRSSLLIYFIYSYYTHFYIMYKMVLVHELVSSCEKSCCATHHLKYKKREFFL